MRSLKALPLVFVLIMVLAEILLYSALPATLVSHWNFEGRPDGYMDKFWFNAFFTIMTLGIYALFIAIPKIDPLRRNFGKFLDYYYGFVALFSGFMLYIYLAVAASNLGYPLDIGLVVVPAASAMIFCAGMLCRKSGRNWFVGIRTPWTLSSDRVWEKTNRLGGRLLQAFAVLLFFSIIFVQQIGSYFLFALVIPLIAIVAYTTVYSYVEYRKEDIGKEAPKARKAKRRKR